MTAFRSSFVATALAVSAGILYAAPARAQMHHHHGAAPPDSTVIEPALPDSTIQPAPDHDMDDMEGMEHHHHGARMEAMYGPYPMTREASGTAWQPDRARHQGIHVAKGAWLLMVHGMADLVYDHQGGPRGDDKTISSNMLMAMAQRRVGPGMLGLRSMVSAEPWTIGKEGYPLLLQTGETADGTSQLIDRQHPHDLFMELAGTYSVWSESRSMFLYAGLPGEPALGPPAFMHRFSGMAFPQAPITHHWLDSSHITFGVLTGGVVSGSLKLEASAFRGREPDQGRLDIESPKLDSHSFRLSLNPTPAWALQVSRGRLKSPEQLEPDIDVDRTTASILYARDGTVGHWESTLAWGRNKKRPGGTSDGFNAETAVEFLGKNTLFARYERVEKDELFEEPDPRAGTAYWVGTASAGYRFDFRTTWPTVGIGVLGSLVQVPSGIRDAYGKAPAAVMVFAHVGL